MITIKCRPSTCTAIFVSVFSLFAALAQPAFSQGYAPGLIEGSSEVGFRNTLGVEGPWPLSQIEFRRDDRNLTDFGFMPNGFNASFAFSDKNADDKFSYRIQQEILDRSYLHRSLTTVTWGECISRCERDFSPVDGFLPGWIPVITGFYFKFTDGKDHPVTNVEMLIDGDQLIIGYGEKDEGHPFEYWLKWDYIDPTIVAEPYLRLSNEGHASKGKTSIGRADTGGQAILMGFSFTYKGNESGYSDDVHGVANFMVDLNNDEVEFNDGDSDDYFEYVVTYATLH